MTRSPKTSQTPSAWLIVGMLSLPLATGCGSGSGQGVDENGNLLTQPGGTAPGGGPSGNLNATLAWVQSNVLGNVNLCSKCHIGAGAPFGVNWSSETDTCSNVGRPSAEMANTLMLNEIEAGNPDASYMIWKIQGAGPGGPIADPIFFDRMPAGGMDPLPAATIQNMRDWIADGVPGCPP